MPQSGRRLKKPRHFVYILRCADGSLYVGYAKDLARRLQQHNHTKQGARYTRSRRPVELVYSESFATLRAALRREYALKTWPRKKKLALLGQPPAYMK